jgi:hypothetical protein
VGAIGLLLAYFCNVIFGVQVRSSKLSLSVYNLLDEYLYNKTINPRLTNFLCNIELNSPLAPIRICKNFIMVVIVRSYGAAFSQDT